MTETELSQEPLTTAQDMELPRNEQLYAVAKVALEQSLGIKAGDKLLILMHQDAWAMADAAKRHAKELGAEVQIRFYSRELSALILEGMLSSAEHRERDFNQKNAEKKSQGKLTVEELAQENLLHEEAEKDKGSSWNMPLQGRMVGNVPAISPNQTFIRQGIILDQLRDVTWANKFLIIRNKKFKEKYDISETDQREYDQAESRNVDIRNDAPGKHWLLMYEPDMGEKEPGETEDQFKERFYSAIDRPWKKIEEAQNQLIEFLRGKKEFSVKAPAPKGFPADWETDIKMSIEGMDFWNSTILHNLPGSEIFTAPKQGTLNGKYSVGNEVIFKDRLLPNLQLIFEEGKVVKYDVFYEDAENPARSEDLKYIKSILDTDDGASFVGELGIGTNAAITKVSAYNTLNTEKVGGSIHLAIGAAYKDKNGVHTDNGVVSAVHIDITKILTEAYGGGQILVDGEVFQENGKFVLPGMEVLNSTEFDKQFAA